jgi:formylglycine-generating enzyme required for sulfatase activity
VPGEDEDTDWSGNSDDDLARVAWYSENSDLELHDVAQKEPNPFGLFDMHGNVWEWCGDEWHPDYEHAPADGSAWLGDGWGYRVDRGGSWRGAAQDCRSAYRGLAPPGIRSGLLGFRPAGSSPDPFTTSPHRGPA